MNEQTAWTEPNPSQRRCKLDEHTNTHTPLNEHVHSMKRESESKKRKTTNKNMSTKQRMQAIKGVSMFYARSSRINSGIIQVEWMCFALFCSLVQWRRMWFRFGLSTRQYRLSYCLVFRLNLVVFPLFPSVLFLRELWSELFTWISLSISLSL